MAKNQNPERLPLTRERVIEAAIDVADQEGLAALTMRRLGAELGVEAMSLYKHVQNKEDILDGIVAAVFDSIEIPTDASDWREAMRVRAESARSVLVHHSWAIGLLEARGSSGASLRYVDGVLGALRSGGFPIEQAAHAFHILDSYVYGHVIQEVSVPVAGGASDSYDSVLELEGIERFPHLIEMSRHAASHSYSYDKEFEIGLELILDALEKTTDIDPQVIRSR